MPRSVRYIYDIYIVIYLRRDIKRLELILLHFSHHEGAILQQQNNTTRATWKVFEYWNS